MSDGRGATTDSRRETICYGCDYPRTGLSAEVDCPECGAPYGAEWTVYATSPTTWMATVAAWVLLLPMGACAIQSLGAALTFSWRRGGPGIEHVMMALVGLVLLIVPLDALRHNLRQNRAARHGAVALGRDEFAVVDRKVRRAERYLLREIRDLEIGPVGDVVKFRYEGRTVVINHGRILFGNLARAIEFSVALKKAWGDATLSAERRDPCHPNRSITFAATPLPERPLGPG